MLDQQKQKKVRKFLQFYLAVRKIVRTFAEDLAALGNLRASSRLRSLAKSLHPATRPAERLHRGPATGIPTTGARDKQLVAPVLSYHRQGFHF